LNILKKFNAPHFVRVLMDAKIQKNVPATSKTPNS